MSNQDMSVPYYAAHKVYDLTCPHCKARLTFLINERHASIHSCHCGRWLRAIEWAADMTIPPTWTYEPKIIGGDYEQQRDTQ